MTIEFVCLQGKISPEGLDFESSLGNLLLTFYSTIFLLLAKLCLLDNFPMLGEISRPGEGPNFYCSLEEEIPLYTGYLIFTSGQIVALGQVLTAGKISPEGPNFDCWASLSSSLGLETGEEVPPTAAAPPLEEALQSNHTSGLSSTIPYHHILCTILVIHYHTHPLYYCTVFSISKQYLVHSCTVFSISKQWLTVSVARTNTDDLLKI